MQDVAPLFKASSLKDADAYPQWSQNSAKANQIRHMAYWMQRECKQRVGTEYGQVRAAFWGAIVAQDVLCRRAGMFFTDGELDEFQKLTKIALDSYNYLA